MSCLFCSSLLLIIGFIIIFTLVDSIAVVIVVHIHIGRKASRVNVAIVCYRLLTSTTVLKSANQVVHSYVLHGQNARHKSGQADSNAIPVGRTSTR